MRLDVYRSLWGVVGEGGAYGLHRIDEALAAIARSEAGYAGITGPILFAPGRGAFKERLDAHALEVIPQILTSGDTVDEHLQSFREQLEMASEIPHVHSNAQTGSDRFDDDDAERFLREALRMQRDMGLRVAHETHRGRILFHPRPTRRWLDRFEELELSCDFSHWCVVCERLVDDEVEVVRACAERALNIDARVGFEEGPQVADPRAPEVEPALRAHERWWDAVWDAQQARGLKVSTLVPELGPPPYQPVLPYSQKPIADLWENVEWMAQRQKRRFAFRGRS